MNSLKLKNIMKFNNSSKIINSKKRLSVTASKLNFNLPDLNIFLNQNLQKQIQSSNNSRSKNHLTYKESEKDIKNKNSLKSLSDIENSNNSLEKSNYKILFKKKINLNKNNQFLTFNKSKNIFYNSNDNSNIFDIEKKNKINLYNNSAKNNSQLYLFNSYLNSSTSIQTSSHRKNAHQKINLNKSNKNIIRIRLNQYKINQFSSSDNNILIDNGRAKTSNNSNKKQKIIIMNGKMDLSSNKIVKEEIKIIDYSENKVQFLKKFQIENNSKNNNYILDNKIKNTIKNIYKYLKYNIEKSYKVENTQKIISNIIITPNDFKPYLMKYNKSFYDKIEKSLIKKTKKKIKKRNKSNHIDNILVKLIIAHTEDELYKKIVKKILTEKIFVNFNLLQKNSIKKLESLRYNTQYQQNFSFIQERFIKKDLIITENEPTKTFKIIKIFPEKVYINKKFSLHSRKGKKKFSLLNNMKLGATILNRTLFNREGDKIKLDKRMSFIKQIKLKPPSKVKKIDFEIKKLIRNRNMTKEKAVYRTQELKVKLKKELKSIEEILFFLIKENNFQEFKDIQEKFHVSLESRNENNDTFLTYAVQFGYEDFIQYLINNGANINAQNNQLNTPLHYALNNKNYKIADILLKEGADETIKNKYNLTPWQYIL